MRLQKVEPWRHSVEGGGSLGTHAIDMQAPPVGPFRNPLVGEGAILEMSRICSHIKEPKV